MQPKSNYKNVPALFYERAEALADKPFLLDRTAGGWSAMTWQQTKDRVEKLAAGLLELGIQKPVVTILAGNTSLWPTFDLAAMLAGGYTAGLYPTSSPEQCVYMVNFSESQVLVLDSESQLEKIALVGEDLTRLRYIIVADEIGGEHFVADGIGIKTVSEVAALGEKSLTKHSETLLGRLNSLEPEDTAALVFTSGTTGHPKAAVLSHRYFLRNAEATDKLFHFKAGEKILSYLPYCHVGERIFGFATSIYAGRSIYHLADIGGIFDVLKNDGLDIFGGIPRLYEKLYEELSSYVQALPAGKKAVVDRARQAAAEYFRFALDDKPVPASIMEDYRAAETDTLADLRKSILGPNMRLITSGAASLPAEVADFFVSIGLPIYEAYGLTEHICALMNRPNAHRVKTVGKPMPFCETQIRPDGELWLKGENLFNGYLNNEEATRDAFDESGTWFKTGDIVAVDEDGYFRIIDRKKEILVTSTGKNITPTKIENAVKSHPLVSNVMLVGDGRSYITALITLNAAELEKTTGITGANGSRNEIQRLVDEHIEAVNGTLNRTEQIKRFHILDGDFTIAGGELTPTLKLKRRVIREKFKTEIDALYEARGQAARSS